MPAHTRRSRVVVLTALAAVVLALTASVGPHGRASAHTPHPGIDFSLGVDTNGDTVPECGTGVGQALKCTAARGSVLHARVDLNSLGGLQYAGFEIRLDYTGVSSKNDLDAHAWPACVFQVQYVVPGLVAWGCIIGVPPAPDSTYIGLIGTTDFNCTNDGTIVLVNGGGETDLGTSDRALHATAESLRETLTINCPASVGGVSADVPGEAPDNRSIPAACALGLALAMLAGTGIAWVIRRRLAH